MEAGRAGDGGWRPRGAAESSSDPPKSAELKSLHGPPRGGVVMAPGIQQVELGSKHCTKNARIITHDRQAAAPFRSIQCKAAYDNVSTGPDGLLQMTDIGGTIGSIGEEMKRSAVVPQIVSSGWLPGGDICNHPFDVSASIAKTFPCRIESGGGQIQNRNLPNFPLDKRVNQS